MGVACNAKLLRYSPPLPGLPPILLAENLFPLKKSLEVSETSTSSHEHRR